MTPQRKPGYTLCLKILAADSPVGRHSPIWSSVYSYLCRYLDNFGTLKRGMADMGFSLYVPEGPSQGCIISTFLWPDDPTFDFNSECFILEVCVLIVA